MDSLTNFRISTSTEETCLSPSQLSAAPVLRRPEASEDLSLLASTFQGIVARRPGACEGRHIPEEPHSPGRVHRRRTDALGLGALAGCFQAALGHRGAVSGQSRLAEGLSTL